MAKAMVLPDEKVIDIKAGETLLEATLREGIPHVHACGGHAKCTTCRVVLIEGGEKVLPRNKEESGICTKLDFPCEIRLACQSKINGNVTFRRVVLDQEDMDLVKHQKEHKKPVSLGRETKAAILFVDIRGFTAFAEKNLSYDVIHVLNRYFMEMDEVVKKYNGVINNTMGDGFLALFEKEKTPVLSAVKAGLAILKKVEELCQYTNSNYKECLSVRLGLHLGDVIMGTIAERETVIGDTVNLASRLEAMNKELKTNFLISETVFDEVRNKVTIGKSCKGTIRGKKGEYQIYEVLNLKA